MCIMYLLVCEVKLFLTGDNGPEKSENGFSGEGQAFETLKKHHGGEKLGRSGEKKRIPGCLPHPHTIPFGRQNHSILQI